MNKANFIFIKLKNIILPLSFVLFTIFLILFSKENLDAAKNGLNLFLNAVFPSLFPFFIATELLGYTNLLTFLGRFLDRFMKPLFNVPGVGAFALIMGIICGYPVGAKIVSNLRQSNICTKEEAERLLSFTNNSGPLFIISAVGIGLFGNKKIGFILLISHVFACISVGLVFRFWKNNNHIRNQKFISNRNCGRITPFESKQLVNFSNLGEILSKSISQALSSVFMIGGFIVFFSVIISILESTKILQIVSIPFLPICNILKLNYDFLPAFFGGIIELTNGVKNISQIPTNNIISNILTCSFLLGFGGFSVALQVLGIISKTDISFKPYILGKFLQGVFSAFYTFILLQL